MDKEMKNTDYTLTEGRFEQQLYQELFDRYIEELGRYCPRLLKYPLSRDGHRLTFVVNSGFESPVKHLYIIRCGCQPAGLAVFSEPEPDAELDGCTHYIEELYVCPEFRGRGIAMDIALRFLRQREGVCGICVIRANEHAVSFWENVARRGGFDFSFEERDEYRFYKLRG